MHYMKQGKLSSGRKTEKQKEKQTSGGYKCIWVDDKGEKGLDVQACVGGGRWAGG
jgi:hypothetical protein